MAKKGSGASKPSHPSTPSTPSKRLSGRRRARVLAVQMLYALVVGEQQTTLPTRAVLDEDDAMLADAAAASPASPAPPPMTATPVRPVRSALASVTSSDDTPRDALSVGASSVEANPDETSPDEASPDEASPHKASPDEASPDEAVPEGAGEAPDDASTADQLLKQHLPPHRLADELRWNFDAIESRAWITATSGREPEPLLFVLISCGRTEMILSLAILRQHGTTKASIKRTLAVIIGAYTDVAAMFYAHPNERRFVNGVLGKFLAEVVHASDASNVSDAPNASNASDASDLSDLPPDQ